MGGGQETSGYNRRLEEAASERDVLRGMDDAHLAFGEHGRERTKERERVRPRARPMPRASPHSKKRNFKVSLPLGDLPQMTSAVAMDGVSP